MKTTNKIYTSGIAALLLGAGLFSTVNAAGQITAQLDLGATGTNVTNLQQFLAADVSLYPQGLVTGYYGSLTAAAVSRFQARYGFAQVGRVGPLTLAKINSLMLGGSVSGNALTAPQLYSVSQGQTSNSATFNWLTDENANARVFYNTSPVQFNEGDINSVGFGATTGMTAQMDSNFTTSHSVTLSNLMPNTTYFYTLVSTDLTGNASVYGPNNTFRTN
jgi:peptidoglycan hydrolase-like protein with peptidoglycan-binding domain